MQQQNTGPLFPFTFGIFSSALLLFVVQPMFAKMALPMLGGSPAVWTTCMLFFQTALLAGYMYAHASVRLLGVRRQALLHAALVLVPLALLPIGIDQGRHPSASAAPIVWLISVMMTSVGAPFFVLSTTAPLLQRWFSLTRHRSAGDPYFLYAASNAGSLAGLLMYPTIVEPFLSLRFQRIAWSAGYVATAALVAVCALLAFRSSEPRLHGAAAAALPVPARRKLRWVALAFAPSGLLLAVTAHISTDIAAVPMMWVVPLALYLSTFIIAFSNAGDRVADIARRLLPLVLLPLILIMIAQTSAQLWFLIPLHMVTFWVLSLLCHLELARDRPAAVHLTGFYVWMAAGGMLGGLFNTLVAPLLFVRVAEYPILIAAACLILARPSALIASLRYPLRLARPAIAGLLAAVILGTAARVDIPEQLLLPLLAPSALLCFSVSRQPGPFAVGIVLLLVAGMVSTNRGWGSILYAERTFFGVYRVSADRDRPLVSLFHGSTLHGSQTLGTISDRPEPLTYYHRGSPIADVIGVAGNGGIGSVAVIGLGVGSLAAYAEPGQQWAFYEIDPVVERIARDERYFTFLRSCGGTCRVVIGDGRLALDATMERSDLLVLDAFSSDAIPVHLLTREALQVYLAHLSDDGILAFHISNRHFDLEPVLARLARDQNLVAVVRRDAVRPENAAGFSPSHWVAMARSGGPLAGLDAPEWMPLSADGGSVWTDDFSNIWSALRW